MMRSVGDAEHMGRRRSRVQRYNVTLDAPERRNPTEWVMREACHRQDKLRISATLRTVGCLGGQREPGALRDPEKPSDGRDTATAPEKVISTREGRKRNREDNEKYRDVVDRESQCEDINMVRVLKGVESWNGSMPVSLKLQYPQPVKCGGISREVAARLAALRKSDETNIVPRVSPTTSIARDARLLRGTST